MPVDWKAPDSFNRLLAATVASMDGQMKLNYKRIADFYGEGATYDAIEGRFRIIKKQASKLKEEVENGRPTAPARGNGGGTNRTPRKPRPQRNDQNSQDGVLNGRITKPNGGSPTKKRPPTQIKKEMLESSSSTSNSTNASGATTEVDTPGSNPDNAQIIDDSFTYDPTWGGSFDMSFATAGSDPQMSMVLPGNFWDDEVV